MDDRRDAGVAARVLRAAQRGDPSASIVAFVDSLRPAERDALLDGLSAGAGASGGGDETVLLLRALWPAPALHPRLLVAATAAAALLPAVPADALLTEAEALLVGQSSSAQEMETETEVNGKTSRLDARRTPSAAPSAALAAAQAVGPRLRRLTDAASALMAAPVNMHTARMMIACARCCAQVPVSRGRAAAARIFCAIVRRLADPDREHAGAAILALLQDAAAAALPAADALLLREHTVRLVQRSVDPRGEVDIVASRGCGARGGHVARDIPAILRAVLGRLATARLRDEEKLGWAHVAVQVILHAPIHLFSDLLSVLEWQLAEAPAITEQLLRFYRQVSGFDAGNLTAAAPESQLPPVNDAGPKLGERDVALLVSILRSSLESHATQQAAFRIIAVLVRRPGRFLDMSTVAASSSPAKISHEIALEAMLQGAITLPGMELRCEALVGLAYWLALSPDDEGLRRWGANLLIQLFMRYELARLPVLDALFCSLTEDICSATTCVALCDALERIVSHSGAAARFRNHVGRIKHWMECLSTMPVGVAVRLARALALLAAQLPAFCDFFVTELRKLSSTRSTRARQIASGALSVLITDERLEPDTADNVIHLACEMLETGALRSRALFLSQLTPCLLQLQPNFLRDPRYIPLHRTVLTRVASLVRGSSLACGARSDEVCPFQLNACFEATCGEPGLRDSVPELLEYVLALRRVDRDVELLYQSTLAYVGDVRRALRDAGEPHEKRELNPRWVLAKTRLLLCMCEILVDHAHLTGTPFSNLSALLKTYAGALVLRDGIPQTAVRNVMDAGSLLTMPCSAFLECPFSRSERDQSSQMSAREASALSLAPGAALSSTEGRLNDLHELMESIDSTSRRRSSVIRMSHDCVTSVSREVHSVLSGEALAAFVIESELARAIIGAIELEKHSSVQYLCSQARARVIPVAVHFLCVSHPWTKETSRGTTDTGGDRDGSLHCSSISGDVGLCERPVSSLNANGSETQAETSMLRDSSVSNVGSETERQSTLIGDEMGRPTEDADNLRTKLNLYQLLAELVSDSHARAALTRMHDRRASWNLYRVTLRFFALRILTLATDLDLNAPIWERFVVSVFPRPPVKSNTSTTADDDSSYHGVRDGGKIEGLTKAGKVAHAFLACFEEEFEYSMSTSLSVSYVQFLDRVLSDATREFRGDASMGDFGKAVSSAVTSILRTYRIVHPRVLRPMFALLLKSLKTSDSITLLGRALPWLASCAIETTDDDPKSSAKSARRERLTLTAEDLDDGGIDGNSDNEDEHAIPEVSPIPTADSVEILNNQPLNPREDARDVKDHRDSSFSSVDIQELSLAETPECRNACLLGALSFIEMLIPRRRAAATGGSVQVDCDCWIPHNAELSASISDLLECVVFGERLSSNGRCLAPACSTLPSTVQSRIASLMVAMLSWARDAAKFLTHAMRSNEKQNATRVGSAASLVEKILGRFRVWQRTCSGVRKTLFFEGRVRYVLEHLELESASALAGKPRTKAMCEAVAPLATLLSLSTSTTSAPSREQETDDIEPLRRKKRRRPIRSRNTVVDEWLVEDDWSDEVRDDDNYADMEDYIVGMECDE